MNIIKYVIIIFAVILIALVVIKASKTDFKY